MSIGGFVMEHDVSYIVRLCNLFHRQQPASRARGGLIVWLSAHSSGVRPGIDQRGPRNTPSTQQPPSRRRNRQPKRQPGQGCPGKDDCRVTRAKMTWTKMTWTRIKRTNRTRPRTPIPRPPAPSRSQPIIRSCGSSTRPTIVSPSSGPTASTC